MEIIAPLGFRKGPGTFDAFFNEGRYKSCDEAEAAGDYVCVNFVRDENGVVFFEHFHTHDPETKLYTRLQIQHFPFGIDVLDDQVAQHVAQDLFDRAAGIVNPPHPQNN